MLNNLLLTVACAVVLVGTLYPLAMEVLADFKMSVGAPFYNLSFAPLFVLLLLAVPFGPLLAWKRGDLLGVTQRLLAAGVAGLVVIALVWAWTAWRPSAGRDCGYRAWGLRHRRGSD